MSCECRKDFEEKLLEKAKEQFPEAKNHTAELTGYTMVMEHLKLITKPFMPFEITYLHKQKNGTEKTKKLKQNFIFSYCPFCGEKI